MNSTPKYIKIDINIGDQLTTVSCGHIVTELVKFLVYQRLQIPYNYQWMKHLINQKKARGDQGTESFQSQRHYHTVNSTLENLDFMIKSLLQEINGSSLPEEVCVIFGASPFAGKEVYRFLLPSFFHKQQCRSTNIASDNKIKSNVFRTLVTNDDLNQMFFQPLSPTNMYVLLQKKNVPNKPLIVNMDSFSIAGECRVPHSCKMVVVDFREQLKENMTCCSDFQIFADVIYKKTDFNNLNKLRDVYEFVSTDKLTWFQCSYIVKGYKDCLVNGSSITNMWLGSTSKDTNDKIK